MAQYRNYEIDGLRGWAAVIVLFFHFFQELFGKLHPILHSDIFFFLLNGSMMVKIFFILSGDALSAAFFSSGLTKSAVRIVIARYFRLTFPIFITCFLVFLSLKMGIVCNHQASLVIDRPDWLGHFLSFEASLQGFFSYVFAGVYGKAYGSQVYNDFLWTMSWEMLGSLLVFINIFALNFIKEKYIGWILLIQFAVFYLVRSELSLFVAGILLGYLRHVGLFEKIRKQNWNFIILIGFFVFCLVILPFYRFYFPRILEITSMGFVRDSYYSMFFFPIAIVLLAYSSKHLGMFFSNRASRYFGSISFPIYIFQFNVLVTYTSWVILKFNENSFLHSNMWIIIPISSILITFIMAEFFKPIERYFLIHLNNLIEKKLMKEAV